MLIENRIFYEDCGLANMPFDKIQEVLSLNLSKRERDILVKYYDKGMKLVDIGKDYDLTRERIRQIRDKAINKLKKQNITFTDGVLIFRKHYEKAIALEYVNKPVSWAMYQAWEEIDKAEKSKQFMEEINAK